MRCCGSIERHGIDDFRIFCKNIRDDNVSSFRCFTISTNASQRSTTTRNSSKWNDFSFSLRIFLLHSFAFRVSEDWKDKCRNTWIMSGATIKINTYLHTHTNCWRRSKMSIRCRFCSFLSRTTKYCNCLVQVSVERRHQNQPKKKMQKVSTLFHRILLIVASFVCARRFVEKIVPTWVPWSLWSLTDFSECPQRRRERERDGETESRMNMNHFQRTKWTA